MRRFLVAAFAALLLAPMTAQAQSVPNGQQLFICAGQSNMSGRGVMPASQATTPNGWMFALDYHWKPAAEPSDDVTNAVDSVLVAGQPTFSPCTPFAVSLSQIQPSAKIGLIQCAVGSTSLNDWLPSYSDQTIYGACLKRARAASPYGTFSGILWWQGEQEAVGGTVDAPDQYAANFKAMASQWRTDLGSASLPIVLANIRPFSAPNTATVRQQIASIPSALPNSTVIETSDLPDLDGGGIHVSTAGDITAGARFATAYQQLVNPAAATPTATVAPSTTPAATATVAPTATATPTPVPSAARSLTVSSSAVPQGGTVTVSWVGSTTSANNFIGIYQPGGTSFLDYKRLDCTQGSNTSSPANGSCPFTLSEAKGAYEVRLYDRPTNAELAMVTLTIT